MFTENMLAPCGLDCSLCVAALKSENPCPGCMGPNENKPEHCVTLCKGKLCEKLQSNGYRYCSQCDNYPCEFNRETENRYMSKYVMRESPLTNLNHIQVFGMREFLNNQRKKWSCKKCEGIICVHTGICNKCGRQYQAEAVTV